MMNFTLERQNHMEPNFEMLDAMRKGLEMTISSDFDSSDFDWQDVVRAIVPFQFEDGSFNLLDSYRIESDCRVYYCHEATYICTALLMKALLVDESILGGKERSILPGAMHMCCARQLSGSGYDGLKGQLNALNYFMKCDVKGFLAKYPDMCPEFTEMMQDIEQQYAVRVQKAAFKGAWGEDYEAGIRKVREYFDGTYIFVYGTLMKNQANHEAFLKDEQMVCEGEIDGYKMYSLGSYPGIVKGTGTVEGEVYRVTDAELAAIDRLEGEGVLYTRTMATVRVSEHRCMEAFVYVYNGSLRGRKRLGSRFEG